MQIKPSTTMPGLIIDWLVYLEGALEGIIYPLVAQMMMMRRMTATTTPMMIIIFKFCHQYFLFSFVA